MAVDEARACRHPHGLKDKLKPNPTQQDALKGILPLKKVSVYIGRRSYELVIEQVISGLQGVSRQTFYAWRNEFLSDAAIIAAQHGIKNF